MTSIRLSYISAAVNEGDLDKAGEHVIELRQLLGSDEAVLRVSQRETDEVTDFILEKLGMSGMVAAHNDALEPDTFSLRFSEEGIGHTLSTAGAV